MYTLCLPWTTCAGTYICHNPGPRTPVPRGPSAVGGGTLRTALGSWRASRGRRNNAWSQYVRSPPPAPCVLSGGTPYQRHGSHAVEAFGDGFSRHVPARRRARRASILRRRGDKLAFVGHGLNPDGPRPAEARKRRPAGAGPAGRGDETPGNGGGVRSDVTASRPRDRVSGQTARAGQRLTYPPRGRLFTGSRRLAALPAPLF